MAAKFEISKNSAGKFRFHLKAPYGAIITASQGYATHALPVGGSCRHCYLADPAATREVSFARKLGNHPYSAATRQLRDQRGKLAKERNA